MPQIETSEIRIHYERAGSGAPLLFISGTGGDLRAKPNVFDGPLPKHFDVLAYDQRGLGQTDKPPGPYYAMADYADDAAALLDAVGWERCRVMGVSFGGMVAQEFALRYPERIEKLVLACTSSGGAGGASYPLHEIADLPIAERARRYLLAADTRTVALERDDPERFAKLLAYTETSLRFGEGEPGREEGQRLQLEARRHHDTYDRLRQLAVPVLIAAGRYDNIAPPENAEALQRQIARSTLEFFEGGHLFLIQDRRAHERIIEWLA